MRHGFCASPKEGDSFPDPYRTAGSKFKLALPLWPGHDERVRRHDQYCPVSVAVEVLGSRWTLLILYELLEGTRHFNDLQRSLPGISRSVLLDRLQYLQREGLIVRRREGSRIWYDPAPPGNDLRDVIWALARWGARWALPDPRPEKLDPAALLWSMHHHLRRGHLPRRQTVVEFRFTGCRRIRAWLVLKNGGASVCLKHPGFERDLIIETDVSRLYQAWYNRVRIRDEIRTGRIRAQGPRHLVRSWPEWFAWPPLPEAAAERPGPGVFAAAH